MKLEAKQRLQAFDLVPNSFVVPSNRIRLLGDQANAKGLLEFIHGASTDPRLTVGFMRRGANANDLVFYLFYDGRCRGNVVFSFNDGAYMAEKAGVALSLAATPHASLDKDLQRSGIVSTVYAIALNKNISLIADSHTVNAAVLWDKLGKRFNLYHVDAGQVVPEATQTSFKILTRKKI